MGVQPFTAIKATTAVIRHQTVNANVVCFTAPNYGFNTRSADSHKLTLTFVKL